MNKEDFWAQVRDGLKEGLNYTVHKTEELTRIGRLKVEIYSQKRRIAREFAELGGQVFLLLDREEPAEVAVDTRVRELILELKKMKASMDQLEIDLADSRKCADTEVHETETGESITVHVVDPDFGVEDEKPEADRDEA
jgi:hypothetical protein